MKRTVYVIGATLVAIAGVLWGQEATNTFELGSILVEGRPVSSYRSEEVCTATFFDAPPEELPVTVDVLTEDFIREQSPNDLHDLLFFQPGINGGGKTLMDRTSGQYTIRGKAGTTPTFNGTLPLTSAMGIFLDPNALERVEIVKGPVGASQGGQTSTLGPYGAGGAINMILKRPKFDDPFARVGLRSSFGSHLQRYRLTADYNDELADGIAFRLPFSSDVGKPFWLPSGNGWRKSFFLAPSLLVKFSDDFRFGFTTTYQQTDTPAYQGIPSYRGKPLPPYSWDSLMGSEFDLRDKYRGYTSQAYLEWTPSDIWQLETGAGYAGSDTRYLHIASSTYANQPGIPVIKKYDLYWGDNRNDIFNLYGRAIAKFASGAINHTALIQTDGLNRRSHDAGTWSSMPLGGTPTPPKTPSRKSSLTRYGAFAQDYAEWGMLRLLTGARYDRHESNRGNSGDAWSPRVGLSIVPDDRITLFSNVSRSSAPNFGYMKNANEELTSAWKSDQGEAGIRVRTFDKLWMSLAGYYMKQRDTPTFDSTTGFYVTEGKSKNRGLEASLSGNIAANWSLYLGYAYNHNILPSDQPRAHSQPPHAVTLQTMYRFTSGVLEEIGVGAGYRYKKGWDGTMQGRYVSSDYFFKDVHVIDLSLEIPLSRFGGSQDWSLGFGVKNLFNKHYFESNRHYYQCFPGDPRTFEIALQGSF